MTQQRRTVNQLLDLLLENYRFSHIDKDESLQKLYIYLVEFKSKWGGNSHFETDDTQINSLIKKYLEWYFKPERERANILKYPAGMKA